MNDLEIAERVAILWVSLGGDADGFVWCEDIILKEIRKIIEAAK